MVLLHLRSSQAEFDAYLFATHGPTRARRAWAAAAIAATTLTEKYMHSRGSLSSKGVRKAACGGLSNYLPTWLAPAGQKSNYLPTYLCTLAIW